MSEKKLTVIDLMTKLEEVGKSQELLENTMKSVSQRNEYMILRFENLMKAVLNVDTLPNLDNKRASQQASPPSGADDLFDPTEVPI